MTIPDIPVEGVEAQTIQAFTNPETAHGTHARLSRHSLTVEHPTHTLPHSLMSTHSTHREREGET
jgi:hypothetical protein